MSKTLFFFDREAEGMTESERNTKAWSWFIYAEASNSRRNSKHAVEDFLFSNPEKSGRRQKNR
jgi:hypothetical protein